MTSVAMTLTAREAAAFGDMRGRLGVSSDENLLRVALGCLGMQAQLAIPAGCFDVGVRDVRGWRKLVKEAK